MTDYWIRHTLITWKRLDWGRRGRSGALFRLADAGCCEMTSSTHAVIEAVRNAALKAPFASETLEELLDRVEMVKEADPRLVA